MAAEYQTFKAGVKACLPTVFGYLGIGFAAGVIGKSIGLSVLEIFLMSTFIYAGGAQFIICGLIAIHSPISAIIFTTFLVNLRHLLMSMSVATYFEKHSLLLSIGIGTLLTDEAYGVLVNALQRKQKVKVAWTYGLNVTAYLAWITATVIGGGLGAFLPQPQRLGLDFALLAMFIGLFVLQAELPFKKQLKKTSWIILVVCLTLYVGMRVLTPEVSVMVATLVGCSVGMVVPDDE
ncbi:AzlC family ABC transporter permease [Enterococcus faecalis]